MTVEALFDSDDAGQTLLEAAELENRQVLVPRRFPPAPERRAEEFYFRALVTSLKRIPGGPDDAIMLRATLEIDERTIVEGT